MNSDKYKSLSTLQRWMPAFAFLSIFPAFAIALIFEYASPIIYKNIFVSYIVEKIALVDSGVVLLASYTPQPERSAALVAMMLIYKVYYFSALFIMNWPGYFSQKIILENAKNNPKWRFTRGHVCLILFIAIILLAYDLNLEPAALSMSRSYSYTLSHPIFADFFLVRTRFGFATFALSRAVGELSVYWFAVAILLNFQLFWNKPAANRQTKLESRAHPSATDP